MDHCDKRWGTDRIGVVVKMSALLELDVNLTRHEMVDVTGNHQSCIEFLKKSDLRDEETADHAHGSECDTDEVDNLESVRIRFLDAVRSDAQLSERQGGDCGAGDISAQEGFDAGADGGCGNAGLDERNGHVGEYPAGDFVLEDGDLGGIVSQEVRGSGGQVPAYVYGCSNGASE